MYKTTGIIDKNFYESIKYHVYPKKTIGLFKIYIIVLFLCYFLFSFWLKDLEWAFICVFSISLFAFLPSYVIKKKIKINMNRMQENYHTDSMDMSTEFTEEAIIISSSVRQDPTKIYYQDISRVVLTQNYYLIFTKTEQLICVFTDQLQERDRLGLIGFLKEKVPKIKVYKEKVRRKYLTVLFLVLLYVSFAVFLIQYFKTTENTADTDIDMYTEMEEADFQPELDDTAEAEQQEFKEITYHIKNPSWEYYCSDTVTETVFVPTKLEFVCEVENEITDLDVWLSSNEISVPQFPYNDGNYSYTFTGAQFYEATGLMISELSGENQIYYIDMKDFSMLPHKIFEENDPFTNDRGYVNFAKIVDHILYISTGHKGYTENNPSTGYITAIDLENGQVLWKSAPQVSNAYNFEIVGDVIICGYGFTDEDDFLYLINRSNGQVIEQIPLKSMAEYIVAKDSTLYVRTYNRNYEFQIYRDENDDSVHEMIFSMNKIFYSTGKDVSAVVLEEMEKSEYDTPYIGKIRSVVDSSLFPTEELQANFECKGSEVVFYDEGIAVNIEGKWIEFEEFSN